MDSLGCMMLALNFPACTSLLGPVVPGRTLPAGRGCRGHRFELDPVQAAFNIGCLVRWLDLQRHLACRGMGTSLGQPRRDPGLRRLSRPTMRSRSAGGTTAADCSRRADGDDPGPRDPGRAGPGERIQSRRTRPRAARARRQHRGGDRACSAGRGSRSSSAVSNAWIDGGALRTYRHAPNTGPRKSWAAGDATSRAVRLALLALNGAMAGYARRR